MPEYHHNQLEAADEPTTSDALTDALIAGEWLEPELFHARLTAARLAHPEVDTLYALHAARISNPARRRDKTAEKIKEQQQEEPARAERFKKVPARQWEGKNNEARTFLEEEYQGRCQICDTTFPKRDGRPYFEGLYLVSYTQARWIDRPGNVLCLCATCGAKFQHGSVEAEEDVLSQVERWRASREGGSRTHALHVKLCGEEVAIRFSERHTLDLQELLTASSGAS
jgi:hypothetical protein